MDKYVNTYKNKKLYIYIYAQGTSHLGLTHIHSVFVFDSLFFVQQILRRTHEFINVQDPRGHVHQCASVKRCLWCFAWIWQAQGLQYPLIQKCTFSVWAASKLHESRAFTCKTKFLSKNGHGYIYICVCPHACWCIHIHIHVYIYT